MYKHSLLFLLLITSAPLVWADDAVEAAATGNIVFEKAPELIMQDETLIINKSASKNLGDEKFSIDVDFHFKNISDHDITRKIAFVLPPVQCRMDENSTWRGLDTNDEKQTHHAGLKDFTTTIDNKPQSVTTRTEAMLGQKNITDLLTTLQIPLNPCKIRATDDGKPDPKYDAKLQQNHLLTESNDAAWSENNYFEWTQTFPAGKVINIHHHYTPVIGEAVLSARTLKDLNAELGKNIHPIWNRKLDTLSHSNPSIVYTKKDFDTGSHQKRFCVMPEWVQYHLTTGANWNGGIGVFKLIIQDDADLPFVVNKFYNNDDGVHTSINGNTMIFTIKNFIPSQDLHVLFLSLPQSTEELQACGI